MRARAWCVGGWPTIKTAGRWWLRIGRRPSSTNTVAVVRCGLTRRCTGSPSTRSGSRSSAPPGSCPGVPRWCRCGGGADPRLLPEGDHRTCWARFRSAGWFSSRHRCTAAGTCGWARNRGRWGLNPGRRRRRPAAADSELPSVAGSSGSAQHPAAAPPPDRRCHGGRCPTCSPVSSTRRVTVFQLRMVVATPRRRSQSTEANTDSRTPRGHQR